MNSVRLLPVVMVAAGALFLFKVFGIVSGEGYSLSGAQMVSAQEAPADPQDAQVQEDMTQDSTGNSLADDASMSAEEMAAQDDAPKDALPITLKKDGEIVSYDAGDLADTERAILARLSERRKELDALEKQLQVQEDIVRAAEKRLETRAAELKQIEARIQELVDRKEGLEDEQFQSLVSMYENMKSADAARIFDRLDMLVLVRMVEQMNPRKMAAILADMDSEKAEALTINLANPNLQKMETAPNPDNELPQIVGQ
jgi:flagellar motility protein MotE (MotC chaperone)